MNAVIAASSVVVLLIVVTGLLAAAETVVVRTDVVRALRLQEEGRRGSDALLWLTEHRGSVLNVLLVATVTARVVLAGVATILGWELLGDGWVGAAIAALIVIAISLTGAEVAPRTLVLRSLESAGVHPGAADQAARPDRSNPSPGWPSSSVAPSCRAVRASTVRTSRTRARTSTTRRRPTRSSTRRSGR